MNRPHTWYFGNLYWRGRGGKDQGVQIFISDKPGILIHAKALAKGKANVFYDLYERLSARQKTYVRDYIIRDADLSELTAELFRRGFNVEEA